MARQGDGPVLVGVDGSSLSDRAVAFAFDEAARCRSALEVVNVWHPLDHIAADRWSEAAMQEHRERRLSRLEESVAGGREKYPEVPVRLAVADGRPAATLVELSERAALVVVGSRGHGGIAGLLLGSVSQNLLHHARCSVAVVRNGD
jgi:nucleotide-binding universal stress UspA family protein